MKKPILILLMSCIAFINCSESKDDFPDTLPTATQTGANTAGCLIDGELVLKRGNSKSLTGPNFPEVSISKPTTERNYWSLTVGYADIFFNDRSGASINLIVKTEEEIKEGNVYELSELKSEESNYAGALLSLKPMGAINIFSSKTSDNNKGRLVITKLVLDGETPFIAGTFEFKAGGNGRLFNVMEGRFDLKFDTVN